MQYTISLKTHFFLGFLSRRKRNKFQISMKFYLKDGKKLCWIVNFSFIWWASLLINSSYEPHGINVSGFTFILHQKDPKKPQSILSLSSWGWNSLPGACSDLDVCEIFLCTLTFSAKRNTFLICFALSISKKGSNETLDRWHVTHDMWHVTCDTWHIVWCKNSLKILAL